MQRKPANSFYWLTIHLLILCAGTQSAQALIISEIMYHPTDEQLEFIELYNHRAVSEDLGGYAFTRGIEYTFEPGMILGPKAYLVIALDPNALRTAYGIPDAAGPYTGRLNNGGERIELVNPNGGTVLSIQYYDTYPWPIAPDGTGHSVVLTGVSADPDEGRSWRASTLIGGTPGTASVPIPALEARLRINEIMADPSGTATDDWLELYNAGPAAMDLSRVYLSDDAKDLLKVKLPDRPQLLPGHFWAATLASESQGAGFALKPLPAPAHHA